MARFHTQAGYFTQVIEKQPVTITQNEHSKDENGNLLFHEDGATPVMQTVSVDTFVDVPMRVWVDQVDVPFTPEEEAIRDIEEQNHAIEQAKAANAEFQAAKKAKIDALTLSMSEQLLMADDDGSSIKAAYRESKKQIDSASNAEELAKIEIK